MRLVIWNCRYGLKPAQATKLAGLHPDVAVVPEAEETLDWPASAGPAPVTYDWLGSNPTKGLGVASFGSWTVERSELEPRSPWSLALEVQGPEGTFRLIAVWTVHLAGTPRYAAQVRQIIDLHRDELADGTTVLAGDLNCSGTTADPRPHLANVGELRTLGLASAFHAVHGVEPGSEPMGTLYWRWQESAPFHCDLGFVPAAWVPSIRNVEVGTFDEWVASGVSDHAPVIIDLDLPDRSAASGDDR